MSNEPSRDLQRVGAVPAVQPVAAGAAVDQVVAFEPAQPIVDARAAEPVPPRSARMTADGLPGRIDVRRLGLGGEIGLVRARPGAR